MLHTSSFADSPTEIRNKIKTLIGEENANNFWDLYYQNYVNSKDIDRIAEAIEEVNFLSLPITGVVKNDIFQKHTRQLMIILGKLVKNISSTYSKKAMPIARKRR